MILLTLNKDIVKELFEHKLRNVKKIISNLPSRWNETSAETFLKKAKDGTYPEAENDAIDLTQLLLEEKKLIELLNNL